MIFCIKQQLKEIDLEEIKRCDARNNLEEFVNIETKSGGLLSHISHIETLKELKRIKTWHNGSLEEYINKLKELKALCDKVDIS